MNSMLFFDLPPAMIPPRLHEIAEFCGQKTAWLLLQHFPGVHLHVPKRPSPEHKLAEILGMLAFSKLCEQYGNELLTIPRAAAAIRAARNQRILADFAAGKSQAAIAIQYGLTERQVNTICNSVMLSPNLDIFDL